MAYELEIISIAIGVIYGYLKPGKEDRAGLLKKGVLIGVILGLFVVGFGILVDSRVLLYSGVAGMIGLVGLFVFVLILFIAVLFIIGTFMGDWLEEKTKPELKK